MCTAVSESKKLALNRVEGLKKMEVPSL